MGAGKVLELKLPFVCLECYTKVGFNNIAAKKMQAGFKVTHSMQKLCIYPIFYSFNNQIARKFSLKQNI